MIKTQGCESGLLSALYQGKTFKGAVEPMMKSFAYYTLVIYEGINVASAYNSYFNNDTNAWNTTFGP
jgi:hypothetical protein